MILVDNAMWKWKKTTWCHMVSDTSLEELHQFAQSIGLARSWFQDRPRGRGTQNWWMPHYDLTKSMRGKAIRYGAVPVDARELIERAIWATSHVDDPQGSVQTKVKTLLEQLQETDNPQRARELSAELLRAAEKLPNDEDPGDCPFCTQTMKSGPAMVDHMVRHHAGEFR